jgi:hypothetical protein
MGAPQSQQIADRFHLILNLSATMERVLEERSRQLVLPPAEDAATDLVLPCRDSESDAAATAPKATPAQLRRQRRLDRYEQVVSMFNSGQSQAAIASALGMGRRSDAGFAAGSFQSGNHLTAGHLR